MCKITQNIILVNIFQGFRVFCPCRSRMSNSWPVHEAGREFAMLADYNHSVQCLEVKMGNV